MDIYDIDGIIRHALQSGVDISPTDRQEWRMFCCALKVLGYDESTFVQLSSGAEKDSRKAWREERNPNRYKTEESAKGMIVELAKQAGVEVNNFMLSPQNARHFRPTSVTRKKVPAPPSTSTLPISPDYIPMEAVTAAEKKAHETALYAFMCKEFGEEETKKVFEMYHVGGSKMTDSNGYRAMSFPYIDYDGRVIDCKLFHIDAATGSRKTAEPLRTWTDKNGEKQELRSSWALSEMNIERRCNGSPELSRAKWCNFGDHLLRDRPTATVCIVESEKSALIAALTYPDEIWIAVGSKNNLNPERTVFYQGREVVLFPDRDSYNDKQRKNGSGIEKSWRTIARELAAAGLRLKIDITTERYYPKLIGDKECKADIADLILDFRHRQEEEPQEQDTTAMTPPTDPVLSLVAKIMSTRNGQPTGITSTLISESWGGNKAAISEIDRLLTSTQNNP